MKDPDYPYRVGKVVYRSYTEAVIKAEAASRSFPTKEVKVVHQQSQVVLRTFKNGVAES